MKKIVYYTVRKQVAERDWRDVALFVDQADAERAASEITGWYGAPATAGSRTHYVCESYEEWKKIMSQSPLS